MLNQAQQQQCIRDYIALLSQDDFQLLYRLYTGQLAEGELTYEFRSARLATIMARPGNTSSVIATLDLTSQTTLACLCATVNLGGGLVDDSTVEVVMRTLNRATTDHVLSALVLAALLVPVVGGYLVRLAVCTDIRKYCHLPPCLEDLAAHSTDQIPFIDDSGRALPQPTHTRILRSIAGLELLAEDASSVLQLVEHLLLNGGLVEAHTLFQNEQLPTTIAPVFLDRLKPAARLLAQHGLIIPICNHNQLEMFGLPGEAAAALYIPIFQNKLALDQRIIEIVDGKVVREERHTTLVNDMAALLAAIIVTRVTTTQKMEMNRQAIKKSAKRAALQIDRYLDFLQTLVVELELLDVDDSTGLYELTINGHHWLALSRRRQQLELIYAWMESKAMVEYAECYGEKLPENYTHQWAWAIRNAASWEILNHVRLHNTTPDVVATYFEWRVPAAADLFAERHGYTAETARKLYTHRLITETMYWLGLVKRLILQSPLAGEQGTTTDVAYTVDHYGKDVLATVKPDEDSKEQWNDEPCILQANGEIIVPPSLATGRLFSLLLFCERLPGTTTVRLTRNSLRQAISVGIEIDAIRTILQSCGIAGVPQPIEFLLDEMTAQQTEYSVGSAAVYISADSKESLDRLAASSAILQYEPIRIAPTVLVLRKGEPAVVQKELMRLGLLPRNNDEAVGTIDFIKVCS